MSLDNIITSFFIREAVNKAIETMLFQRETYPGAQDIYTRIDLERRLETVLMFSSNWNGEALPLSEIPVCLYKYIHRGLKARGLGGLS